VTHIAYYRVSTHDQSVDSQRQAIGVSFDREFKDEGVSGSTLAESRPGFAALMSYVREGDTVYVYAIDRLGRDALDVQAVIRKLLDKGVIVDVRGLGPIGRGVGELVVAVLAQIADMEKLRIKERCDSGRVAARAAMSVTGLTHKGKHGLGRPMAADRAEVASWRSENRASIAVTAAHFGLSKATVKRYCAL
jgi:putative DNA-invertase from lambdoid prophage Rac